MQREQACIRVTNVIQDGKLRSGESIQRRESFAIGDDEASGVCDPRQALSPLARGMTTPPAPVRDGGRVPVCEWRPGPDLARDDSV